jgi:putative ABC transport system permease protein
MLTRYLLRFISLHHFRHHPLRTLLSLLGMIVGVTAFIFAPSMADTVRRSLDVTAADIGGSGDLEIRIPSGELENSLLEKIRQTEGVRFAVPLVTQGGLILGRDELLTFFGIDPMADRGVRTYELTAGAFLARPGQVLLTSAYATEKGISIGDEITLVGPGGTIPVTVVGFLGDRGPARLNGGDVLVLGITDAWLLRGKNTLNAISIMAEEGADMGALQAALGALLPPNAILELPQTRFAELNSTMDILDMLFDFSAVFFLVLGATIIYNTLSVSVVQRRNEIGVLRALGVTRGGVQILFLTEAAVLGAIGSLLGVSAGCALVGLIGKSPAMPVLGPLISYADFRVPARVPPIALMSGILIASAAGYLPARAATKVEPMEIFGHTSPETRHLRMNRARALVAATLMVLGLLLIALYDQSLKRSPLVLIGSGFLILAAVAAFPVLLAALRCVLPEGMRRLAGPAGLIAAENLTRRSSRMLAAGTILVLGMWLVIVTGLASFGYGDLVKRWDQSENIWDLTLTGADITFPVPPDVIREVSARPDVAATAFQRVIPLIYNGKVYELRAEDIASFRAQGGRHLLASGDDRTLYGRMLDHEHPALLFTGLNAFTDGLDVGQTVTLETAQGSVAFELAGSPLTYMNGLGRFTIDYPLFVQLWGDTTVDALQIKLKPGTDIQAVRREMMQTYAIRGLTVFRASDYTASMKQTFHAMTFWGSVMLLLTAVILIVGLANTLVMMTYDRRREIGMLRAVGLLRGQIIADVLIEAALLVLLAGLLMVPVTVFTINAIGMVIQHALGVQIPTNPFEIAAVVSSSLLTAILASYLPARGAGRTDVMDALRLD